MSLLKVDKSKLVEPKVKTTPENVKESNLALFRATMNLPTSCQALWDDSEGDEIDLLGILKYNEPDYDQLA